MNWLWKFLGYHVCEEFTSWETHTSNYQRLVEYDTDGFIAVTEPSRMVKFTVRFQERKCKACGKIQQRRLKH